MCRRLLTELVSEFRGLIFYQISEPEKKEKVGGLGWSVVYK